MRAAHHRTRQSWLVTGLVFPLAGCAAEELAPTIWPPADFRVEVEERAPITGFVARRFVVDAAGVAVYATATAALADAGAALSLPVYDRVSACQLVPECTRALARRLQRLGIGTLDAPPAAAGVTPALRLRWRAFASERETVVAANVEWALGEVLHVLSAHLPPGEPAFAGCDPARRIEPALQGAPAAAVGSDAAAFWRSRAQAEPADDGAWAAAFACACARGARREAVDLLRLWRAAGQGGGAAPAVPAAALERLLPPPTAD